MVESTSCELEVQRVRVPETGDVSDASNRISCFGSGAHEQDDMQGHSVPRTDQ